MALSCIQRDLNVTLGSSGAFVDERGGVLRGDTANPISGIFDRTDVRVPNGEGVDMLVNQVTFTAPTDKLPNLSDGDSFSIGVETFEIRFWEDEGDGTTTLHLEEA